TSLVEFGVPWSRLGGMPDEIDIVAVVQAETTADVDVVHPSQTLDAGATLQNLSKYMTVELTHADLDDGVLTDEVLVYQSYKGTTTASGQKNYDLMVKTQAACAFDWATVDDISMSTNVVFDDSYVAGTGDTTNVQSTIDIARACPVIDTEGTDPTTDGLVDFTRDEDSGAVTFSLTNLADDVQDLEGDLTWTMTKGTVVSHDNDLIGTPVLNGQDVTILPKTDQFGTVVLSFVVTDSNGLSDDHNITFEVANINDAPVICAGNPVAGDDCMPIFSEDEANYNILPEGFGTHTKFLGDVSNATRSYIRDMANEQIPTRQVYTWSAEAVDLGTSDACSAFSVAINNNELTITENTNNELGGKCTVTLGLSDDGAENQEAETYDVVFSVAPVNDAPVILDWNRTTETVMKADNGSIPALPWSISLMEDDESEANLTYDLSAIKADVDHDLDDLYWTVESTDQCVYTNYFTTTIVGDDLVFDLIEDATTNANDWEIDYLNNNGIHQIGPSGSEYCQIRLVLRDTVTAPTVEGEYNTYVPNYDPSVMPIAAYEQGVATKEIGVRVENVREQVPDYFFDDVTGFNFNGVTNIMTGTYVPVTVTVGGGGDEGPYRYDHMLAITYHTDGHDDVELTRYYAVPDYGASVKYTEDVYITKDTTHVWVEMDVVTCLANPCDLGVTAVDRFQADEPASHYAIINNVQSTDDWSKPGQYGKNATKTSERRPLLEDSNWCNNIMTSLETADVCNHANQPASTFLATSQNLPDVVETIGASSVPSFAPSVIAVALAGLFVSALSFSSRRADDEEEVEAMVDDDAAVSPVIATILMVAITVVLSGVIYVWASSLAETDVKGVPRMTFDIEDINGFDADEGHWRITVAQSQTPLATQAVEVAVTYLNATGQIVVFTVNLAESGGVYGFSPQNSDAFVTFVDSVQKDGNRSISTFNTGDTIFVRTHAPDGTPLVDVDIQLSYAPLNGKGSVLKKYSDLSYDKKA
ncbi:MAG: type IV pilin, partial [archaeon]|nr:type IV pilin [archaeon]